MAAIDGATDRMRERVGNDPVRATGSLVSLLPSIALHALVAAMIWPGFTSRAEVRPPVTFIALAPAAAPAPPEPLPLPPTGMRLPLPEPPAEPKAEEPPFDFEPPTPEPESFPFDPNATRPTPDPEPADAVPIEKVETKPKEPEKPKREKPKEATAKPKPAAKPKPKAETERTAGTLPTPVQAETPSTPHPASPSVATTPARPAGNPAQNAALSDAPVRVTDPNYAGACPISYPERARKRNQEGTVVIHALIGPDGKPIEVTVAGSSGHRLLDEAARTAIAGCAFVPQKVGGRAVRAIVEIPIPFKLI